MASRHLPMAPRMRRQPGRVEKKSNVCAVELGALAAIWRYPVKSLAAEHLEHAESKQTAFQAIVLRRFLPETGTHAPEKHTKAYTTIRFE